MIDIDSLTDSILESPESPADSSSEFQIPEPGTAGPLYFDLETVPDSSREELFGLEPLPEPIPETPKQHLLDPKEFLSQTLKEMSECMAKKNPPDWWIEAVRTEEKAAKKPREGVFKLLDSFRSSSVDIAAAKAERCKKMSVTPEFCRIAAFGIAAGDREPQAILCPTIEAEKEGLQHFWDCVANVRGPLVGFNILGFDLPVILVRSAILRVKPKKFLGDVRPWSRDLAIDLMQARFPRSGSMKLKDLARFYGIPVPAGDCDGSQVADLFQSEPSRVAEYVKSDVTITRELHRIWNGYFC